ncbi:acyl carrier protein [Streptomyces sp. NPDC058284]|uniref:acyl carrier protein n=1 Tax=unclassified Streptomyces TaxID=2593676 RepID=UPI0036616287
MSDVSTTVHRILTDDFEVPVEAIRPQTALGSLDLDSLALAEFAFVLKEQLGVGPAPGLVVKATTIDELIASLEAAPSPESAAR